MVAQTVARTTVMKAIRKFFVGFLWFALAVLVVGTLGFPLSIDLTIIGVLALVSRLSTRVLFINLGLMVALFLTVIELPTRLLIETPPFYRPQDQFAEVQILKDANHQRRYLPNIKSDFFSPHGDLVAIGGKQAFEDHPNLIQPKTVRFETDEHGYRNSPGSASQAKLVLLGDSFVAGDGLDQRDTVASQIRALTGLAAYSLAFPDDPPGYTRRLRESAAWLNPGLPKIIFLFAGNDFQFSDNADTLAKTSEPPLSKLFTKQLAAKGAYARLLYQVLGLRSPVLLNNIYAGLLAGVHQNKPHSPRVLLAQTSSPQQTMALYQPYLENANPELAKGAEVQLPLPENQLATVRCLVLIPSKEQLYLALEGKIQPQNPLASVAAEQVLLPPAAKIVDLLPSFIANARTNPSQPIFISDDTHWTPHGARLAVGNLYDQGCLQTNP